MNKQEILETLDLPSVPDFPTLHALCRDPGYLENVLSLAIACGERKGRTDTINNYNDSYNKGLHGENFPEPDAPTNKRFNVGLDNVVGYVLL